MSESIKARCPNCKAERWANVLHHAARRESDSDDAIWSNTDYRMLQCKGCEEIYVQTDYVFSEDEVFFVLPDGTEDYDLRHTIEYWPAEENVIQEEPSWLLKLISVDEDLHRLMSDVYAAINANLDVLAAIAIRTVFDRATEFVGVDPAISFAEKLKYLIDNGKIGLEEKQNLTVLVDAGGAAAHRGWRPSQQELQVMVQVLENFIYRNFLLGDAVKKLASGVPPRQQRVKA